jgi:hypothetical protein
MKKTRVAIYYHNYLRNDGPPLYYFNVLKNQLKLETYHLVPEGDTRRFGKMDYHFWVDYGEDSFIPDAGKWQIPDDGGKKIYVASDTHLDKTGYRFAKAKQFDYVFFNQKHAVREYLNILGQNMPKTVDNIEQGWAVMSEGKTLQRVFYLPHAAEPKAYPKFSIVKKYDLCFIGHIQENQVGNGVNLPRIDVLDYMFKRFPNFYFGTRNPAWPEKNMFEDAAKKFCQSKIVLNISIGNDVNMRFFETLSTGSFLLTNKIPELKNLEARGLIDGIHYVSYSNLIDAQRLAEYYIEHDNEREKIAKAGHKAFTKGHTYKHRLEEILRIVGGDNNG